MDLTTIIATLVAAFGLFTANEIVRHHGGRVRVRTRSGEGTVVRLSFPAVRSEP